MKCPRKRRRKNGVICQHRNDQDWEDVNETRDPAERSIEEPPEELKAARAPSGMRKWRKAGGVRFGQLLGGDRFKGGRDPVHVGKPGGLLKNTGRDGRGKKIREQTGKRETMHVWGGGKEEAELCDRVAEVLQNVSVPAFRARREIMGAFLQGKRPKEKK